MVPGVGAGPDLLNAAIHGVRGNWQAAGWSALAAIPFAGDAAKASHMGIKAARSTVQKHHPIPKFLGGDHQQYLTSLPTPIHKELHSLLRENLQAKGIPLNIGGIGGSKDVWDLYLQNHKGSQDTVFNAVLEVSRIIDNKYGTKLTQDVWKNIYNNNFKKHP